MYPLKALEINLIKPTDFQFVVDELDMYNSAEDDLIDYIKDWYPPKFLDDLIGYLIEYYEELNNPHAS